MDENEISVISTETDRTILSSKLVLAGFLSIKGNSLNEISKKILIPIDSSSHFSKNLFFFRVCPRYQIFCF